MFSLEVVSSKIANVLAKGNCPKKDRDSMACRIVFLLLSAVAIIHVNSVDVSIRAGQRPPPPPSGCNCAQIVVSSNGLLRSDHSHALGPFQRSSSHFNAFKSTVYRNSQSLTLTGGANQYWRIHGGSRAGRIMARHTSCKDACPFNCSPDWKVYKRPGYLKDTSIKFECRNGDDDGIDFP